MDSFSRYHMLIFCDARRTGKESNYDAIMG
jgi:hypothetical protein